MSNHTESQPKQAVIERPRRKRGLSYAAALGGTILAMAGNPEEGRAAPAESARAFERAVPQSIEHNKITASAETHEQLRLRRVTELPGWGIETSISEAEKLQESTLKLQVRHKEFGVSESCTFVKVELPSGGAGGITAAHCFANLTGHKYGLLSPGVNGYPKTQEARDILSPDSSYEFFVLDPKQEDKTPIAKVTGIAVEPGKDIALLKIESLPHVERENSRDFDDVPTLPYKSVTSQPKAGQKVAYSSVPSVSGGKLIGGDGVYIGNMKLYNPTEKVTQLVHVVAQTPRSAQSDPGSPGASGGSAALRGGEFFHSLSGRVSLGYTAKRDTNDPDYRVNMFYWNMTQKQLAVRLPKNKFNVLSFYQVQTESTIPELEAGFGKYITMDIPRK